MNPLLTFKVLRSFVLDSLLDYYRLFDLVVVILSLPLKPKKLALKTQSI